MGTYGRHVVSEKLFPYKATGCLYITLTAPRLEDDSLVFTSAIPLIAEKLMTKMGMWNVFFELVAGERLLVEEFQPEFDYWFAKYIERLQPPNYDQHVAKFAGYQPDYESVLHFINAFREAMKNNPDALIHATCDPLFDTQPSGLRDYPKWTDYGEL